MTHFPNFHVTVTDNINDIEVIDNGINHYCLLFAGKLNYFGTLTWEQHALTQYKQLIEQTKNKNIKVSCKFVVYESDELLSGHNCNRLSGFGDIYKSLFNTIENLEDITQILYPNHYYNDVKSFNDNDIEKYNNIVSWLENSSYNCQLKRDYFEHYCNQVFCDIKDNLQFYYVNSDAILNKIQTTLNNQDIKSVYGFGQHFQIGTAYSKYPDMFNDCDDWTLVIKVRYDCVYFDNLDMCSLKNVFYSVKRNDVYRNFFLVGERFQSDNFNIYQLPTVMYTRMRHDLKLLIHSFPHDMSLIFNRESILFYAKHYTDYIVNQAAQVYNINDKGLVNNYYLGLNIHVSLGKFFKDSNFNQLDYTPTDLTGKPVNVFGTLIRDIKLPNDCLVADINDDYKLRWYNNYDSIKNTIIEKFGKHDNT
jgi:hypothetical protein